MNANVQLQAKDVLPNTNRTQAATRITLRPRCLCTPITPGSDGMVPSVAAWRYLQPARYNLSLMTLTFDLGIQTPPSEGPNTSSLWIWCKAVPKIYHIQTKKSRSALKTEPSAVHCVRWKYRMAQNSDNWPLWLSEKRYHYNRSRDFVTRWPILSMFHRETSSKPKSSLKTSTRRNMRLWNISHLSWSMQGCQWWGLLRKLTINVNS